MSARCTSYISLFLWGLVRVQPDARVINLSAFEVSCVSCLSIQIGEQQHAWGEDKSASYVLQEMVGRGQRAMRLFRTSSKQEMQSPSGKEPQIADRAKSTLADYHVWPLAARRRCFALLRKVHLADASDASDFYVTRSTADTTAVWPLTARRRVRRFWRASLRGKQ